MEASRLSFFIVMVSVYQLRLGGRPARGGASVSDSTVLTAAEPVVVCPKLLEMDRRNKARRKAH